MTTHRLNLKYIFVETMTEKTVQVYTDNKNAFNFC